MCRRRRRKAKKQEKNNMRMKIKTNRADATAVTCIIKTLGAKCECDDTSQEQELLPDN